ncbi:MAG: sigma-70 family RNA polymerase sigma factor [Verrucomicrobiota bacterium]
MSEPAPHSPTDDRTEDFLRLLTEHEHKLALYVTGLIVCPQDAQDVLQEGKIIMWRHFAKFEQGTNFPAWARKILFHQVLSYRRRTKRDPSLLLSEEMISLLSEETESALREGRWEKREQALQSCLLKLKTDHRKVVQMRYRDEASIEKIARRLERTEGAIYRLLSRLRQSLFDCVERELKGTFPS